MRSDADIAPTVPAGFVSPGGRVLALAAPERPKEKALSGRELFEREWVRDDARAHGGDGLGPVFNDHSCVACHDLGGTGGAGRVERNIEIASWLDRVNQPQGYFYSFSMDFGSGQFNYRMGNNSAPPTRPTETRLLTRIHPGFAEARSVVLQRYGTDPAYSAWRDAIAGLHGTIEVAISARNPPPLFGLGLIDAIPDEVLEAAAKRKLPNASLKGRVSRLKDGRIGRFGWKAQTATLKEFVISAAAGELGLEVPGRRQGADPRLPGIMATGLDLNESECDTLVAYVRNLPRPVALPSEDEHERLSARSGAEIFKSVGCTHCHIPKLGAVEGIYSDLLLHDMSPALADADSYSVFVGGAQNDVGNVAPGRGDSTLVREWRTPPLWGLRDSGPYLHDGRATTIGDAIALHAGQGAGAAKRYMELSPRRKQHLVAFLTSLAAPQAQPPKNP